MRAGREPTYCVCLRAAAGAVARLRRREPARLGDASVASRASRRTATAVARHPQTSNDRRSRPEKPVPVVYGLKLFGGTGQLVALDPTTGAARWTRTFTSADYGAATVSHDVVFTSTLDGKIYALSTKDGSTLWSAQAPAGVNAFPAIDGKLLLVGAAAPVKGIKHPSNELVAYSLP